MTLTILDPRTGETVTLTLPDPSPRDRAPDRSPREEPAGEPRPTPPARDPAETAWV